MAENITILHLSDMQFGINHRFFGKEDTEFDSLLERLHIDLSGLKKDHNLKPDLVILSGDLTEWASLQEFDDLFSFVEGLSQKLNISRKQIIMIPGNHDINRKKCEIYFTNCGLEREEPKEPFFEKWTFYKRFFDKFYNGIFEFTEERPYSLFEIPELKVVVAGLNSTIKESHLDDDHYGWVTEKQLKWFKDELEKYKGLGWFRIAAVHHNIQRGVTNDDENLHDADKLKTYLKDSVNLVLHGHTHQADLERLPNAVPILATGSAALKKAIRPDDTPNQYQIIQIFPNRFKRYCRAFLGNEWVRDGYVHKDSPNLFEETKYEFENVNAAFPIAEKTVISSQSNFPQTVTTPHSNHQINHEQFVDNTTDDETFAKAIFGAFSYEKRYRDSNSKNCYFPRPIDSILDERLRRSDWVLVEGHPLAGKTRAVFEAIKRLMATGKSVTLWTFKAPEQTGQPLVLPNFPEADCRIVWMDDIDTRFRDLINRGYSVNAINQFLGQIADVGFILVATTRTGPLYYEFRYRFGLDVHLWDKLEAFHIPRLAGEEEKKFTHWYVEQFGENLPGKFDHHPGSLFIDLKEMERRWYTIDKTISEYNLNLNVENAKDIMLALYVFYVMGAYRAGGLFQEEHIRFYLRRKSETRQSRSAFAAALSHYRHSIDADWQTLVELLSQDKFHLGFLRQEGAFLLTETAYLDYIVAPNGEKNIVDNVPNLFSEEERGQLGLTVTRYDFNDVFRNNPLKSEKDLDKLLRKLKQLGIEREITIWHQLIQLCPNFLLAKQALVAQVKEGVPPDVVSYSILIAKAKDYETAYALLAEMKAEKIEPNIFTYNSLFAKDISRVNANELLNWYLQQPFHPELPIKSAIASYKRVGLIDQALVLVLNYPHLDIAHKFMRENEYATLSYFQSIIDNDPFHGNGNYAMGLALVDIGRGSEASPFLEKALIRAKEYGLTHPRVKNIQQLLKLISDNKGDDKASA
ncbi:MAG: hypothetical protein BWK79_16280 [Beggiatoa sp. IS2]|nr:MAG: hypothetical protein BWK79_16280 [Beggiatoa sp. IS2]